MRTRKEIEDSISEAKREVRHYENRRADMCSRLQELEAELAALDKADKPVVFEVRDQCDGYIDIHVDVEDEWIACVSKECREYNLDPAHVARVMAASPAGHALIDAVFNGGGTVSWSGASTNHIARIAELKDRYFAAVGGGV